MKARGWHVQLYTSLAMITAIKDLVAASPVPVVFDHFGGAQAELGLSQPGFADLLDLVESGKAYVKISGAYRCLEAGAGLFRHGTARAGADRSQRQSASSGAATGRTRIRRSRRGERRPISRRCTRSTTAACSTSLPVWAPDAAIRKTILVDNPARLYGF